MTRWCIGQRRTVRRSSRSSSNSRSHSASTRSDSTSESLPIRNVAEKGQEVIRNYLNKEVVAESSSCESLPDEKSTTETVSEIKDEAHWDKSECLTDFTNPENEHDKILLVGGKELYVISTILTESSDFFKILFGEKFKEGSQKIIELKDVQLEDFIEFLKDNFFIIYELADKFLTPMLFKKCNDFIKENPKVINDFGPRVFDLLQMAIDMKLTDILDALQTNICTSSCLVACKDCKSEVMTSTEYSHGLYLEKDHICIEQKDYIMNLNQKNISLTLEALVEAGNDEHYEYKQYVILGPIYENSDKSEDEDDFAYKSDTKNDTELSTKKLHIYNFTTEGPYHDSTILVKDQLFYVNAQVVRAGAKWFRGRLEKGTQLVVLDAIPAEFELFLNFIYPNAHPVSDYNILVLLEMAARFESPCLYQNIFEQLKEFIHRTEVDDNAKKIIGLIEISVKYNLREVKNLFYKEFIQNLCTMEKQNLYYEVKSCKASDQMKKHKFKADGVFYSMKSNFFDKIKIRKMSADAQRFLLSCILRNVKACL